MAENTITTNGKGGKVDWMTERKEMAEMVKEHILDPFALMAGILSEQESEKCYYPALEDVARVLKLMVEGAHVELGLYCSLTGGPVSHPFSHLIEDAWKVQS